MVFQPHVSFLLYFCLWKIRHVHYPLCIQTKHTNTFIFTLNIIWHYLRNDCHSQCLMSSKHETTSHHKFPYACRFTWGLAALNKFFILSFNSGCQAWCLAFLIVIELHIHYWSCLYVETCMQTRCYHHGFHSY